MQSTKENSSVIVWRTPSVYWVTVALSALLLGMIFWDGLEYMAYIWNSQEEYSHGFLIPVITLFFVWMKKDELDKFEYSGSWLGMVIVLLGMGVYFVGELSTLYTIIQYAFLLSLYGVVLASLGWRGFKIIWAPLLLLVFMIPLPLFLYQGLSAQLQLISTDIGVWVIRLFGISVYVEGNVIDLGVYKLQVVEACSGLRYLFPLMTLGFIAAYLYKGASWKRVVLFLSTIPVTVLMNSFRIGAIGVMVEYWGLSMAEGFLHDFEGWVIFMACTAILVLEMWALNRIGGEKKPLAEVFAIEFPEPPPAGATINKRRIPPSFLASGAVLVVAAIFASFLGQRSPVEPQRLSFAEFPAAIGAWQGKPDRIEQIYLDILKLDDYIITDFVSENGRVVNFYVAYYASQTKGESAHSPRSCIPGGGWQIASLSEVPLGQKSQSGVEQKTNRAVIRQGEYTQLVYYWFQGRGRIITNEYMVKWYLFWDALTKNRTDGALVRLTTVVGPGEDLEEADRRLMEFVRQVSDTLDEYVPD